MALCGPVRSQNTFSLSFIAAPAHPNPNHNQDDQRASNGDRLLLGLSAALAQPRPRAKVELLSCDDDFISTPVSVLRSMLEANFSMKAF
jgi:hypothetical protein